MISTIFWDITLCSPLKFNRNFGGIYRLHLQGHILCDCEAIAYLRFLHLGQFFMEPSDYYYDPINKVLHVIRSVGLIKG
jgi:hypothetical protein